MCGKFIHNQRRFRFIRIDIPLISLLFPREMILNESKIETLTMYFPLTLKVNSKFFNCRVTYTF